MRKVFYGFFVALGVTACNQKEEKAEVTAPVSAIEAATAASASDAPVTYTTSPAQQVPVSAGVKLNPPHGEPGHLCEIAVGAPLPAEGVLPAPVETAPVRPTPINPGAMSAINQPLNTVVNTGPKPRFNPPHGEPWHTCDLEVGAPLN